MFRQLDVDRLLGLFVLGWLVFGFPLMGLWDRPAASGGLPLLPLALFGLWALLIAALAWLLERSPASERDAPGADGR
ncbi:MAG TPA: hypothetical protein PKA16_12450 [Ottowia sp.]|uniref:hypothetical protein n=1 Tax=Ottowia sp. TaxID=1898956 RepID=UPI002B87DBD2|nr:hypothetical protein [Ottowia sp.]HMN22189.1 hypothetical protein [Ottowia sp.]